MNTILKIVNILKTLVHIICKALYKRNPVAYDKVFKYNEIAMMIRTMTILDYEKVFTLWMSCKNMGFNDLDDSREGIEKFLIRNPNTSFVAVEDDEVIGAILAGHDGRRGYIYHTSVKEEKRKQGIGKRLINACLSALKEEGINKAALLVFKKNEGGNDFWEKQGFTVREDIVYRNRALVKMVRNDT